MSHARVIAIDGPSGVGKSSVAKELAAALDWTYLNTGAMYRAVTLAWLRSDKQTSKLQDTDWLGGLDIDLDGDQVHLDGEDVSQAIREEQVTAHASEVSAAAQVRRHLTQLQRRIAERRPCILDGRDIGTVVFPDAFLKIFLVASAEVRAERRWLQEGGEQSGKTREDIQRALVERDEKDSSRDIAPLRPAEDAMHVDTDPLSKEQVVTVILTEAKRRLSSLD